MSDPGSTVPRRQLGRYLGAERRRSGFSLESAAKELEWSKAKMYRIERGQIPLRTHDVHTMCRIYRTPAGLTDVLTALATESKAKGWWHSYGDVIPGWFELYVDLEASASRLRHYGTALIPGLLQTPRYAAAVARTSPDPDNRKVALRLERQQILTRTDPPPPILEVILDESAMRRRVFNAAGVLDRDAAREQLAALAATVTHPAIDVRVLPAWTAPHWALAAGAFVILNFPYEENGPAEPATVYCESITGALYLDKPAEVEAYENAWGSLSEMALNAAESAEFAAAISEELSASRP